MSPALAYSGEASPPARWRTAIAWSPYTRRQETHAAARQYIGQAIGELIERADYPAGLSASWEGDYTATSAVDDLATADFIIETIVEDVAAKRTLFDQLEAVADASLPIGQQHLLALDCKLAGRAAPPGTFRRLALV